MLFLLDLILLLFNLNLIPHSIIYQQDINRLEPMIKLHDDIVKAIENRDSETAIALIEEHYDIQIEQHYQDVAEAGDVKD